MWFRVLKEHEFTGQRRQKVFKRAGQLIDILNRHEAERLLRDGIIGEKEYSFQSREKTSAPVARFAKTRRFGFFMHASTFYSGGRIHLYQYAHSLASLGAEVWLITNTRPKWMADYPVLKTLRLAIVGQDGVPPDLDVAVTDGKGAIAKTALDWKRKHPRQVLALLHFENSKWLGQTLPDAGKHMGSSGWKPLYDAADLWLANSGESAKWLKRWMGKEHPVYVLPPAVNTYALERFKIPRPIARPYAVWSARSQAYKGGATAIAAIWSLKQPFDLVVFGRINNLPADTSKHKCHICTDQNDASKFGLMRDAHMVLAPSLFEGFGMVPAEALASGTPCIVYDLPVLRQNYGDRLIYVSWGDKDAYKRAVSCIAAKGKPDVAKAQAWATKSYGLDAMRKRVEALPYHAVSKKSVTAQMICWWGPTVTQSLESVYPYVDQIVIAHGPTKLMLGTPPDGSLERIKKFPDPKHKIRLEVRREWRDKCEMRNWTARHTQGNYVLMLDADEVWVGLDKWLDSGIAWGCPRWVNFWHDGRYWVHDSPELRGQRWGVSLEPYGSVCPHYRWSWWRPSYLYWKHHTPTDAAKQRLNPGLDAHKQTAERVPGCAIYHFGHVLSKESMAIKHEFYLKRDGRDPGRIGRKAAWHEWDGKLGNCGDGIICKVNWKLPDIVRRAMASAERAHG